MKWYHAVVCFQIAYMFLEYNIVLYRKLNNGKPKPPEVEHPLTEAIITVLMGVAHIALFFMHFSAEVSGNEHQKPQK